MGRARRRGHQQKRAGGGGEGGGGWEQRQERQRREHGTVVERSPPPPGPPPAPQAGPREVADQVVDLAAGPPPGDAAGGAGEGEWEPLNATSLSPPPGVGPPALNLDPLELPASPRSLVSPREPGPLRSPASTPRTEQIPTPALSPLYYPGPPGRASSLGTAASAPLSHRGGVAGLPPLYPQPPPPQEPAGGGGGGGGLLSKDSLPFLLFVPVVAFAPVGLSLLAGAAILYTVYSRAMAEVQQAVRLASHAASSVAGGATPRNVSEADWPQITLPPHVQAEFGSPLAPRHAPGGVVARFEAAEAARDRFSRQHETSQIIEEELRRNASAGIQTSFPGDRAPGRRAAAPASPHSEELEHDLEQLQSAVASLNAALELAEHSAEDRKAEIEEIARRATRHEREAEDTIRTLRGEIEGLRGEVEAGRVRSERAEAGAAQARERAELAEDNLIKAEVRNRVLESNSTQQQNAIDEAISAAAEESSRAERRKVEEVNELRDELAQAEASEREWRKKCRDLESAERKRGFELSQLAKENADLQQEVGGVLDSINANRTRFVRAHKVAMKWRLRVCAAKGERSEQKLRRSLEHLTKQGEHLTRLSEEDENEKQKLIEECQILQQRLYQEKDKNVFLERSKEVDARNAEEQCALLGKELEGKQEAIELLQDQAHQKDLLFLELQGKLSATETERNAVQREAKDAEHKGGVLEKEVEVLQLGAETLQKQIANKERLLQEVQNDLAAAEADGDHALKAAREGLDAKGRECAELEQKLKVYKKLCTDLESSLRSGGEEAQQALRTASQQEAELEQMAKELQAKEKMIEARDIHNANMEEELERREAELQDLAAELDAKAAEIDAARARLAAKNAKLGATNTKLDTMDAELEIKDAELKATEQKVQELAQKCAKLEGSVLSGDEEAKRILLAKDAELQAKDAQLSRLGEREAANLAKLRALEAQLGAKGAQLTDLTAKDAQLAQRLEETDAANAAILVKLKALEAELEAKDADLAVKDAQLAEHLEETDGENATSLAKVKALEAQLEATHAQLADLTAKDAQLAERLEDTEAANAAILAEVEGRDAADAANLTKLKALEAQLKAKDADLAAKDAQFAERLEETDAANAARDARLKRRLKEHEAAAKELRSANAKLKAMNEDLLRDIHGKSTDFEARDESWQRKLQRLETELQEREAELEARDGELGAKDQKILDLELQGKAQGKALRSMEKESARQKEKYDRLLAVEVELEAKDGELGEKEQQILDLEQGHKKQAKALKALEKESARQKEKHDRLLALNAEHEATVEALEERLSEYQGLLDQAAGSAQDGDEAAQVALAGKDAQLAQKAQELEAKDAKLEAKDAELMQKGQALKAKDLELEAKTAEVEKKEQLILDLNAKQGEQFKVLESMMEKQSASHKEEYEKLLAAHAEQETTIEEQEEQLTEYTALLETATEKLERAEAARAEQTAEDRERAEDAEEAAKAAAATAAAKAQLAAGLEKELRVARALEEQNEATIADLQEDAEEKDQAILDLESQLAAIETQSDRALRTAQEQLNDLNGELSVTQQQLVAFRRRKEQDPEPLEREAEVGRLTAALHDKEEEVRALARKAEGLERELAGRRGGGGADPGQGEKLAATEAQLEEAMGALTKYEFMINAMEEEAKSFERTNTGKDEELAKLGAQVAELERAQQSSGELRATVADLQGQLEAKERFSFGGAQTAPEGAAPKAGSGDENAAPSSPGSKYTSSPEYLQMLLKKGGKFWKHQRRGRPHEKVVWLSNDLSKICWGVTRKDPNPRFLNTAQMATVRVGVHSPVSKYSHVSVDNLFSLTGVRNLDLELPARSKTRRSEWVNAFRWLLEVQQQPPRAA